MENRAGINVTTDKTGILFPALTSSRMPVRMAEESESALFNDRRNSPADDGNLRILQATSASPKIPVNEGRKEKGEEIINGENPSRTGRR